MTGEGSHVYVIAGPNGGGKSSIGGATFRRLGSGYLNPDEVIRTVREDNPDLTRSGAERVAVERSRELLERSLRKGGVFAFETTLSGRTTTLRLQRMAEEGVHVHMWYVALESADLHVARVEQRVRKGGHDVPDARIRARYDRSRTNLIRLLPFLEELRLLDNSADADPATGTRPRPRILLETHAQRIVFQCRPDQTPDWAKPIVLAAMRPDADRVRELGFVAAGFAIAEDFDAPLPHDWVYGVPGGTAGTP